MARLRLEDIMSKELSNIEQPFEVEVYGEVTLLRLHLEGGLLAIDLEQIGQLWQFLDQQKKRPSKVLLCLGPSGFWLLVWWIKYGTRKSPTKWMSCGS